jgi:probable F420-dependent oxidoreductase
VRIGAKVPNSGPLPESLGIAAMARTLEEAGFDSLWVSDHIVMPAAIGSRYPFAADGRPTWSPETPYVDALIALALIAAATERVAIGSAVLVLPLRNPVELAKQAASIDVASGGRLELGVGAGWLRDEYERAGMPFDPPAVRVDRLEESLQVLKGLLAGEAVMLTGKHYRIDGLETFPRPVQRPRPPILVGAGSRRMLGIAGREADIVGILPKALPDGTISEALSERSPETIARKVGWVREAAGARFPEVELSMIISPVLDADPLAAAERWAAERGLAGVPVERIRDLPSVFAGPPAQVAETMLARRERFGFSYYVVSDDDMEAFAPVVERLAGR